MQHEDLGFLDIGRILGVSPEVANEFIHFLDKEKISLIAKTTTDPELRMLRITQEIQRQYRNLIMGEL